MPASNEYHFVTHWRVESTIEEVSDVLDNAPDLTRWWPSVYLSVKQVEPGGPVELITKSWPDSRGKAAAAVSVVYIQTAIFSESPLGDGARRRIAQSGTRAARGPGTTIGAANILTRPVLSDRARLAGAHAFADQLPNHL